MVAELRDGREEAEREMRGGEEEEAARRDRTPVTKVERCSSEVMSPTRMRSLRCCSMRLRSTPVYCSWFPLSPTLPHSHSDLLLSPLSSPRTDSIVPVRRTISSDSEHNEARERT